MVCKSKKLMLAKPPSPAASEYILKARDRSMMARIWRAKSEITHTRLFKVAVAFRVRRPRSRPNLSITAESVEASLPGSFRISAAQSSPFIHERRTSSPSFWMRSRARANQAISSGPLSIKRTRPLGTQSHLLLRIFASLAQQNESRAARRWDRFPKLPKRPTDEISRYARAAEDATPERNS